MTNPKSITIPPVSYGPNGQRFTEVLTFRVSAEQMADLRRLSGNRQVPGFARRMLVLGMQQERERLAHINDGAGMRG